MILSVMKKITKATFKSFLKKAGSNLMILTTTNFDGMVDCVMPTGNKEFKPAIRKEDGSWANENHCGVQGVWLVNGSGNSFSRYNDGTYEGIECWNCCGSFIVAVPIGIMDVAPQVKVHPMSAEYHDWYQFHNQM